MATEKKPPRKHASKPPARINPWEARGFTQRERDAIYDKIVKDHEFHPDAERRYCLTEMKKGSDKPSVRFFASLDEAYGARSGPFSDVSSEEIGRWVLAGSGQRVWMDENLKYRPSDGFEIGTFPSRIQAETWKKGYLDGWYADADDPRVIDEIYTYPDAYSEVWKRASKSVPKTEDRRDLDYGAGFAEGVSDRQELAASGLEGKGARKPAFTLRQVKHKVPPKKRAAPKKTARKSAGRKTFVKKTLKKPASKKR